MVSGALRHQRLDTFHHSLCLPILASIDLDDGTLGSDTLGQHRHGESRVDDVAGQGGECGSGKHGTTLGMVEDLQELGVALVDVLHQVIGTLLDVASLTSSQLHNIHQGTILLTTEDVDADLACNVISVGCVPV